MGRGKAFGRAEKDRHVEERLRPIATDERLGEVDPAIPVEIAPNEVGTVLTIQGPQLLAALRIGRILVGCGT